MPPALVRYVAYSGSYTLGITNETIIPDQEILPGFIHPDSVSNKLSKNQGPLVINCVRL